MQEEEEKEAKADAAEVKEKTAEAEKEHEEEEEKGVEIDNNVELWGLPILPSKGAEGIDVVLLKFLRAQEFKVNDAKSALDLHWKNMLL